MKTVLVLGQHPGLAESIRGALNPEQHRIVHRADFIEAEPLLSQGVLDVCVLDAELTSVQGLWSVEKIRRRLPRCPLIVYTGAQPWEFEEEAYLLGVTHVLTKPVRGRMLSSLLERLWQAPVAPAPVARPTPPRPLAVVRSTEVVQGQQRPLEVLRDFSAILTHTLCAEALLKQFLLFLREMIGVNRAAIFLRQPPAGFGGGPALEEARRLRSACAIGLAPGLLEHFELSFEAGLGGHLFRHGRILRRESDEVRDDVEMQKEFEVLGVQVAIPVLDRESLIGVAVFDGRVTGEPIVNGELELIFHLLEELGLAIKNIWLHDQLAGNHEMMADILRELSSACVVVSRDLTVLHANKTARSLFTKAGRRGELEFSDLPQLLGSKVYQVLMTGSGIGTFKYHPPEKPGSIYHITIMPFQKQNAVTPTSALLVAEDFTQTEQVQRLELEAANLRLVKTMAERLAHEVGNALVPLSTHQQLLADKHKDPEFLASLDVALADGVKRISRLISQMRFLARDGADLKDAIPLTQLLEEAFQEAQKHQAAKPSLLKVENARKPLILSGDRSALKQALAEIMLNALQANPPNPQISVRTRSETDANGAPWVQIEVQDSGTGFTEEAARKVPEPFFTTRNVGLGLGLTVSRKIIETHHGKLEIPPTPPGQAGLVRVTLPAVPGS